MPMPTPTYTHLKPRGYLPRLVDPLIERRLAEFGAIEIQGTRWCGKSWTASAFSQSIVRIDDNALLYESDPDLSLIGARPHAIDEWQDVPAIWNRVRHRIDDTANAPGQFILTGSSTPAAAESRHSGAGRISRIRMRTMTLVEQGLAPGGVSLAGLFRGEFEPRPSQLGLEDYSRILCRGGWPALLGATEERARAAIGEYLDLLFTVSMRKLGKDPALSRRIALALARNVGTAATLKTLCADAAAGDDRMPSEDTLASYLSCFALNYFIDELDGWDAPVRSRSRVRTKPKRYFDDPSLASALLAVNAGRLLADGQLFGILFESLCVHDLQVYASLLPGAGLRPLRYYADADGLEVDAIIELADGRWAALEVKLGESRVEEAARNLNRLAAKVAANPGARNRPPEFMAVLVAKAPFARRRQEDGIYVLPLDTLTA